MSTKPSPGGKWRATDEIDPSLERLVNATLLVPFPGAAPPRWVLEGLERGVSGVTLFAINGNVPGTGELSALTAAAASRRRTPSSRSTRRAAT